MKGARSVTLGLSAHVVAMVALRGSLQFTRFAYAAHTAQGRDSSTSGSPGRSGLITLIPSLSGYLNSAQGRRARPSLQLSYSCMALRCRECGAGFRQALAPGAHIVQPTLLTASRFRWSLNVPHFLFSVIRGLGLRLQVRQTREKRPICLLMIHRVTALGSGPWRKKRLRCGFPIVECHGG